MSLNKKTVAGHLGLFCGLLAVLYLALVCSAMIPNEALKDNFKKSADSYNNVAPYHFYNGEKWNGIADNYADIILLNVAWHMGKGNPLEASIDTGYYDGGENGLMQGLLLSVTENAEANVDYTRYWHGSILFLRPLLLFMDVNGVKNLGLGVILLLLGLTMAVLIRKKHADIALLLAVSMVMVQVWNLRLSLEYQPVFLLTFVLCPLYLWLEQKGDQWLTLLSVAAGTAVAFFDFLTTETLTLLLPLILVVAVRTKEGRLSPMRESLRLIVTCGICWGLSYAGAFLVKWTMASFVTGENSFLLALSSAAVRVGGQVALEEGPPKSIFSALAANLTVIFGGTQRVDVGRALVGLFLYMGILGSVWYLFRKKEGKREASLLLLLLGAVVFLRYLVLNNHSYLHEFFTYRTLAAPILASLLILWLNIELPKGRKRLK